MWQGNQVDDSDVAVSCARAVGRGREGEARDATRTEVRSKHEEKLWATRVVAAVRAD